MSEKLKKAFPEFYQDSKITDAEKLNRCKLLLEKIQYRYNIECNPTITRKLVSEIENLLGVL
jgi:hypothetical protein